MAQTKVDPFQVEPGASGQVLAVNAAGVAEWQASGMASGDIIKFNGTEFVPAADTGAAAAQSRAFAYMMGG